MIDLASGYEDQDTQEKLKIGSRMFSGSTGKTYASAVALQLIDEGKFQLDDLAEKYFDTVKGGRYVLNPNFEWCGGGYVSNAGDLAKWLHALHSGEVISEKMHASLVSPVDFRTGQPAEQGYGLGTFVWKTENGPFFGHAGMMPGYLTPMEFSRDHQFAIAFQTNTDESMGRRLHQHVQAIADMVIAASK